MSILTHLPAEGLPELFRIGIRPLGDEPRFIIDDKLVDYLTEKQHLARSRFTDIFAAEPDTDAAQAEVLELVAAELMERYPDLDAGSGLGDAGLPKLWAAAQMVQEDLVLMRRGDNGWRLAAAALCFPSSWRLAEKFGRPMHEVHAPVPEFGAKTRNDALINRMFDHLKPEMPVMRWNWSLYGDADLFHPGNAEPDGRRFGSGTRAENVFLRVERQTLSRLPDSGDILFTIRIFADPIAELEKQPDAAELAENLIRQIDGLDPEQLAYKGLTLEKQRLLARLAEIVGH